MGVGCESSSTTPINSDLLLKSRLLVYETGRVGVGDGGPGKSPGFRSSSSSPISPRSRHWLIGTKRILKEKIVSLRL